MDPNEALYQLLLAMHDGDQDDTLAWLEDLQGWVRGGGALPDVEQVIRDLLADSEGEADPEGGEGGDQHRSDADGTDDDLDELTEHDMTAEAAADARGAPAEIPVRPLGAEPRIRRSSRGGT